MDNTTNSQSAWSILKRDTTLEEAYEEQVMVHKSSFPQKPYEAPKVSEDVPYYDRGGISTIEVIKSKLTPEQYEGFLLGNVIKYSLRCNYKGTKKQDVAKLAEYGKWFDQLIQGTCK